VEQFEAFVVNEVADWFSFAIFLLLLILICAPVIYFCRVGWRRRKSVILANFTRRSAQRYLETFHSNELQDARGSALQRLSRHYDKSFSRRSFLCPSLLGILTSTLLVGPCAISLRFWLQERTPSTHPFPIIVMVALFGGYMFVLYDLILKSYSMLLAPRDIYWGTYRLIISAPFGYAISYVAPSLALPTAILVGAFPTRTILSLGRRIVYGALKADGESKTEGMNLLAIPGIDVYIADAMMDEGITSIQQLANSDPVHLTIRLGQPFGFIVSVIGDALLWCYLDSKDAFAVYRMCGVNGAYDCRLLLADLEGRNAKYQANAQQIVAHLASALKVPTAGIENVIWNVANDPNSRFLYSVWGNIKK
jgi:hypothetical protein